jgi:hypothetical protein
MGTSIGDAGKRHRLAVSLFAFRGCCFFGGDAGRSSGRAAGEAVDADSQLLAESRPTDVRLFRNFNRVVHLDTKVVHGLLKLAVSKQQLHCAQILRPPIDQRRLRASHRMRPVNRGIQPDRGNPPVQHACVRTSSHVRRPVSSTREQKIVSLQGCLLDPRFHCLPSRCCDFELHRVCCVFCCKTMDRLATRSPW